MLELAVDTNMIYNKVVSVCDVTTLCLHILLNLWCQSNTIKNVDPEMSSNVVRLQRLVIPRKDMPEFPRIGYLRLPAGVIIFLVVFLSYWHQRHKPIHRMAALADIMLCQEQLTWTTFQSWIHLQQRIRVVMWPHHPHHRQILPSLLPTTPSVTQLVHCSLEQLPLELLVKTILGIDRRVYFHWWTKVGVFIHRIRNQKNIPRQRQPMSGNVQPIYAYGSLRDFFTNRFFSPNTFDQSIK